MSWPLFAAGVALQVAGQWAANEAQAEAEKANANFYRAQADFAAAAGKREAKLFAKEAAYAKGQQVGTYAFSGVELTSGSALAVMADQSAGALDQLNAIEYKTRMDYLLASSRAQQSNQTASDLTSFTTRFGGAAGTVLTGAASYMNTLQNRQGRDGSID